MAAFAESMNMRAALSTYVYSHRDLASWRHLFKEDIMAQIVFSRDGHTNPHGLGM